MMLCFNVIFIIFIVSLLFYLRSSFLVWAGVSVAYLLYLSFYSHSSVIALILLWPLVIAILAILGVPVIRMKLLTSHAYVFAKKQLPTITPTESQALKAGTVSWDGQLFSGKPKWQDLFSYRPAELSAEEQAFLDGPVEELCNNKYSQWELWHTDLSYREDMVKFAKENGFMGMIIPKAYGGKEFSVTATWQTLLKLSGHIGPLSTWIGIANSIGAGELIDRYGTPEQKAYYLPRLARGDETPCFALTSPIAGSDATSIEDMGIVCKGKYQDKEGVLGVRLNFHKRYITLGNEATLISLAFKLYDPDHLLGDKEERGITIGIVPTDLPGVTHGRRHAPIGNPFPNGPLTGKDVFIPIDNIIGGEAGIGQAWTMLTQVLATGRATSLPTAAVFASKVCFYTTAIYCGIRRQFGLPIGAFESVQEKLAEMAGFTYISDATRLLTFAQIQAGERPAIPAAISKSQSTQLSQQCCIHAIDLQGGKGVMRGPHNLSADLYTSAPVGITVEGSNTMTRGLIIFGQGAVRCHPFILGEMAALQKDDPVGFDKLVIKHLNFTVSNHVRAFYLGLSGGRLASVPRKNKAMKRAMQLMSRLSAAFALLSDVSLMYLGSRFKRMESISGRFADVFSMLYMTSASIKHFHDKGYPQELQPIVEWSNLWALNIAEQKLSEILDNFPNVVLRMWLRFFIFPLGRRVKKPSSKLTLQVGSLVQSSKALRELIAEGLFLTPTEKNPFTILETALAESLKVAPLNKRIAEGVKTGAVQGHTYLQHIEEACKAKLITQEEQESLLAAHKIIMNIINVDDFNVDELQGQL